jgi:phosphoserine phosphatase
LGKGVPPLWLKTCALWHKGKNRGKAPHRREKATEAFTIGNPAESLPMHVVTLLTNPETPVLERVTVESLRNAWGGGAARWLDPGVAAEFDLDRVPENLWQVWEDLQALRVDMIAQPSTGRRKKLLLADMDSTMIQQECIDELADEAGVGAYVAAITVRAMNGELDFEAALRERVGLLRDLPANVIDRVIRDRITLMPGGPVLLATMKAAGAHTALVSGGFTAFTAEIAGQLGFDEHRANELVIKAGAVTGTVAEPILGKQAKLDALIEISARLGIAPEDAIAVGDGANDLAMLTRAGTGVALHAKPKVQADCTVRVNHGDLTALLYLQGYSRDTFATD